MSNERPYPPFHHVSHIGCMNYVDEFVSEALMWSRAYNQIHALDEQCMYRKFSFVDFPSSQRMVEFKADIPTLRQYGSSEPKKAPVSVYFQECLLLFYVNFTHVYISVASFDTRSFVFLPTHPTL